MSFWGSKSASKLVWTDIQSVDDLHKVEEESFQKPVMILKHSTRCSVSSMAKNRLELYWEENAPVKPYYLDLLAHRDVSNEIATRYKVKHESPQIIVLKNGEVIYHDSHTGIDYNTLKQNL